MAHPNTIIHTNSIGTAQPNFSRSSPSETDRWTLFTSQSLGAQFTSSVIFTDGCDQVCIQAKFTDSAAVARATGSIGLQFSVDGLDWGNITASGDQPTSFYQVSGSRVNGQENQGVAQWLINKPCYDVRVVWGTANLGQNGSVKITAKKSKLV